MGFMCSEVIVYFYFSTEEITLINCENFSDADFSYLFLEKQNDQLRIQIRSAGDNTNFSFILFN